MELSRPEVATGDFSFRYFGQFFSADFIQNYIKRETVIVNLTGNLTYEVSDLDDNELEVITIDASDFSLEETGTRNYDGVRGYRALYVYFNSEYSFDVQVEAEEVSHRITDFTLDVVIHSSEYKIQLADDSLEVCPTSAEVEYDVDDWH